MASTNNTNNPQQGHGQDLVWNEIQEIVAIAEENIEGTAVTPGTPAAAVAEAIETDTEDEDVDVEYYVAGAGPFAGRYFIPNTRREVFYAPGPEQTLNSDALVQFTNKPTTTSSFAIDTATGRRNIPIGERIAQLFEFKDKYSDVQFIVGLDTSLVNIHDGQQQLDQQQDGGEPAEIIPTATASNENNNQQQGNLLETINGHKLILALTSPVFSSMFYGQMDSDSTVRVPDCTPAAFKAMLEYIYKGDWKLCTSFENLTLDGLLDIFYTARKYAIIGLEDHIQALLDSDWIKPKTVIQVLQASIFYDLARLTQSCWTFIQLNTEAVFEANMHNSSGGFQLDLNLVQQILGQEGLKIKEVDLFNLVLKWAKVQCEDQGMDPLNTDHISTIIGPLLRLIRFPTMTGAEFSDTVIPTGLLTDKQIVAIFQYINGSSKALLQSAQEFNTQPRKSVIPLSSSGSGSASTEWVATTYDPSPSRRRGRSRRRRNRH